jgi:hypothetical protein
VNKVIFVPVIERRPAALTYLDQPENCLRGVEIGGATTYLVTDRLEA